MVVLSEEKEARRSVFSKTYIDEDGVIITDRKVDIVMKVEEYDGRDFFVLFDEDMRIIDDAFRYLNFVKKHASSNTRKSIAYALRLLYSFLSLFRYDIKSLDRDAIDKLCFFLKGIDSNPDPFSLKTVRSNHTINGYLGIYREFFRRMNIPCIALLGGHTQRTQFMFEKETMTIERKKYDSNLPESSISKMEVPRHVKPDEFRRIYLVAKNHNDEAAMLLLHLMYGYGLRIGECLGITIEDITEIRENGRLCPVIILRNRKSDRPNQCCKGLQHVYSEKQYGTREYSKNRHKIVISYDLYERLYGYIERTHAKYVDPTHPEYTERAAKRYESSTVADIVTKNCPVEVNRYVFLNSLGRPLGQTWDESLAAYMQEAGVRIDRSVGEDSLSHRFRHGFAMFHAHYKDKPVGRLELKEMMRHKSLASTEKYFNLTLDEEYEQQKEFQEDLYELIPELKEGITAIIGDCDDQG